MKLKLTADFRWPERVHIHFCPSCGKVWEHNDLNCNRPSAGVRCPACDTVSDRAPLSAGSEIRRGSDVGLGKFYRTMVR